MQPLKPATPLCDKPATVVSFQSNARHSSHQPPTRCAQHICSDAARLEDTSCSKRSAMHTPAAKQAAKDPGNLRHTNQCVGRTVIHSMWDAT
jgi:hypothetical protein